MRIKTTRLVTTDECGWLRDNIQEGTILHTFHGVTYGAITDDGTAVSEVDGEYPFFEIPNDSFVEIE